MDQFVVVTRVFGNNELVAGVAELRYQMSGTYGRSAEIMDSHRLAHLTATRAFRHETRRAFRGHFQSGSSLPRHRRRGPIISEIP
jgi:hypothetical protein